MPILQPLVNLAELLYQRGVTHVLVSPGSRSAPLTLAVARHPHLQVRVMADERSAGFVALGLAQQQQRPVALICTSGSAVYNLAPAVAEAFFAEVPLLLLTADRPHEWLHQQDGQTIDQVGIYTNHVKRSYDLPADYTHPDTRWQIERSVNEAVTLSQLAPAGPVHLNVPIREPFYPAPTDSFTYGPVRTIDTLLTEPTLPSETWHRLLAEWERSERTLIVLGQMPCDPALLTVLRQLSDTFGVVVVGEIVSNLPRSEPFITQTDTFLADTDQLTLLQPDLLITLGGSLLTRQLKTFLRSHPARRHWHLQPTGGRIVDSFQSLTTLIPVPPRPFLEKLFADLDYQRFLSGDDEPDSSDYLDRWQTANRRAIRLVQHTLADDHQPMTDWSGTQRVLEALPADSILHLANSMPVRYANLCGIDGQQRIQVAGNRGVSGIDGCLSTALGAALATDRLVTLLIGDVAFFYDRNALWSAPVPPNLRIVLLNNDGGHIFRMIDGPSQQPELTTYFETPHGYTARRTAEDAGIEYSVCDSLPALQALLPDFFQTGDSAKLLELTTDRVTNQTQFATYKTKRVNLIPPS